MNNEMLYQEVRSCRLFRADNKGTVKIYLALPGCPVRDAVAKTWEEIGVRRKDGRPPMGALERLIQRSIDGKKDQEDDEDLF